MLPLYKTNNLRLLHTILININSVAPSVSCPPSQSSDNKSNFNLIYFKQSTCVRPKHKVGNNININTNTSTNTKLNSGGGLIGVGVVTGQKYSLSDNIFLNSNYFTSDLTNILNELYDKPQNENKNFTFHFLIKPLNCNLDKLIKQFNRCRPLLHLRNDHQLITFIEKNIVYSYQTTRLVSSTAIIVISANSNKLKNMSL
jgi:hypothetical protein